MAKGLGKGLEALFEDTNAAFEHVYESGKPFEYTEEERKNAQEMPLDKIKANPNQPRKNFDEQALKELADLIQTNGSAIDSLEALAAGHVRFDAAQKLDDNKKTQARTNIGAASQTELTTVSGTATQAKTTADQATSDLAALKTSLGNLSTDFVAAFETALETQVTGLR